MDLILYDDAPGPGWTVDLTMGQSDTACTAFQHTGACSHEIGPFTILDYVYEDPYGINLFGYTLQLWINGYQTVDFIELDDDIPTRGIIGLQIHGGAASEAWYRDITIKEVPRSSDH